MFFRLGNTQPAKIRKFGVKTAVQDAEMAEVLTAGII